MSARTQRYLRTELTIFLLHGVKKWANRFILPSIRTDLFDIDNTTLISSNAILRAYHFQEINT
ncbi:MAG: hypothetical protein ACJAVV_000625 [Alphaproteobacteria bacterium]|jgi:hypothetical protein